MEPGMEIITSDGRRVGHVGPAAIDGVVRLALSPNTIPLDWVTRIVHGDVVLRKTYRQVVEQWGAEPGAIVLKGARQSA
jgi:hypothetical protein